MRSAIDTATHALGEHTALLELQCEDRRMLLASKIRKRGTARRSTNTSAGA